MLNKGNRLRSNANTIVFRFDRGEKLIVDTMKTLMAACLILLVTGCSGLSESAQMKDMVVPVAATPELADVDSTEDLSVPAMGGDGSGPVAQADTSEVDKDGKKVDEPKEEPKRDYKNCLLYTSPSPRDQRGSRMPSSA